ncbi:MAG: ABC transporter substrate-binding protein [Immundisolibacteraceae bacterium]|nr:ABC transporter substrate-binding protein [Immundisolibacteraceae bacterium]
MNALRQYLFAPSNRSLLLFLLIAMTALPLKSQAENAVPARIIVIGGAITEIVYALGHQARIVAVDSSSRHPQAANGLPNVGYMRTLGAEPILALNPDLVLLAADAGPPAVIEQLSDAGVNIVVVPEGPSLPGVLKKIDAVAPALGDAARGKVLRAKLAADFKALDELPRLTTPPRVLFLLSVGTGSLMAAGDGTSADGIIKLAGGSNAITDFNGYKPLSPEAAINAAPDVILVTDRTLEVLGGKQALLDQPWVTASSAVSAPHIVSMDGLLLLGFGPRTATAVRDLAQQLNLPQ